VPANWPPPIGSPPDVRNAGRYFELSPVKVQSIHRLHRSLMLIAVTPSGRMIRAFGPSNVYAAINYATYALSCCAVSVMTMVLLWPIVPVATTGFAEPASPATTVIAASVPPVLPP